MYKLNKSKSWHSWVKIIPASLFQKKIIMFVAFVHNWKLQMLLVGYYI